MFERVSAPFVCWHGDRIDPALQSVSIVKLPLMPETLLSPDGASSRRDLEASASVDDFSPNPR
jgi:hypothetical protein